MAAFLARALNLPSVPLTSDLIIYQHGEVEGASLATIEPNGTNRSFLNTGKGLPGCVAWSPYKTQIAFQRAIIGLVGGIIDVVRMEIVIADPNAANEEVLVIAEGCPAWSADGDMIAYSGDGFPSTPGIWVINTDGTNKTKISDSARLPAWSPDGSLLAVVVRDGSTRHLRPDHRLSASR